MVVSNTLTPQQLVEQVLLGAGVSVSNVTFNGQAGTVLNPQIGAFSSGDVLGIDNGLLLCTGEVGLVLGPNDVENLSLPEDGYSFLGDDDLSALNWDLAAANDVAVLEFDLVPSGDSLMFTFVFGSEEYNEYVCTEFNDVFGFFLSGPGINGTFTNNAVNLALIPGTSTPVAINTVNNGTPGDEALDDLNCALADPNWDQHTEFYQDNTGSTAIQLDGMTVPLQASAAVQCGETYHIKMAVGDIGDQFYDSGVFIAGASFSSTSSVNAALFVDTPDGTLTEGCDTAHIVISRSVTTDTLTLALIATGLAVNGTDHTLVPPHVVLLPGEEFVVLPITAFSDGLSEGAEAMSFSIPVINACGAADTLFFGATVLDHVPIALVADDLYSDCTADSLQAVALVSGGYGAIDLVWSTGTNGNTTWLPGRVNATYTVHATDACARTAMVPVEVFSGCAIHIPNVFTPNGDGHNDHFDIEGIEGTRNQVTIYNRWGKVVYEATNYRNQWNGGDVSDGTYYYEVIVDGDPEPHTGHLTILNNRR